MQVTALGGSASFILSVKLLYNCYRHSSVFFVLINSTKFLRPVSSELVIHRIRVSVNLAVLANIKVIFKFTECLENHVPPGLRTREKTVALFIFTVCLSVIYSSFFERKEVLMHNQVSRTLRFSYNFSVRKKPAQSNTISSPCSNSLHFKPEIVILAETSILCTSSVLSLIYCAHGGSCTLKRTF